MKKTVFFILLLFVAAQAISAQDRSIIYLVSTPRSLSTAFLKMMHYREDFITINEPSATKFLRFHYPQFWVDREYQFHTPSDFSATISNVSEDKNIFVKDVISHFLFYYQSCPKDLFKDKNVSFVFLVRNPGDILFSYYYSYGSEDAFLNQFKVSDDLFNTIALDKLFDLMSAAILFSKEKPQLIFAEDLYSNPHETMSLFCSHYHIPFNSEMLQWEKGDQAFLNIPVEKAPPEANTDFVSWMFDKVSNSNSFFIPRQYPKNEDQSPDFSQIQNPKIRSLLEETYQKLLPHYQKLIDLRSELQNS